MTILIVILVSMPLLVGLAVFLMWCHHRWTAELRRGVPLAGPPSGFTW